MKLRLLGVCLSASLVAGVALAQTAASADHLTIEADSATAKVSPLLYGLMTEEINHSYDGGLYAELIQNRVFQDGARTPLHWSAVEDGGASASVAIDTTDPVNTVALSRSLRLDITAVSKAQRAGVANEGFWGMAVQPNTRYHASFYARANAAFHGPLTVDIESNDGKAIFAEVTVPHVTTQWKKYDVVLISKAGAESASNRFVIAAHQPGTVWFSLVSLFPPTYHDRPNGNRVDLMQRLADFQPTFLRLPGGNYLEGDSIATRFIWKNTIGPLEQRAGHMGPWKYRSSDGMGLLEFFEWCEDLHMAPILAVYGGFSLTSEHVNAGKALAPYVQDALDEIEYVTGDQSTTWGQRRAKDGHPAPFPLTYVEISNEDGFYDSQFEGFNYDGRFAQFFDAIKAKYPNLQIIATTPTRSRTPDIVDEHFYLSVPAMELEAEDHFDHYDRKGPKIFVGEWATVVGSPTPTFEAALADAAWLTNLERNSDLVIMSCYAPLLVNVNPGGAQWKTNLIGYDATKTFGSTSYYAQKMFMTHRGDVILPSHLDQPVPPPPGPGQTQKPLALYASVTRDTVGGTIILKVVNVDPDAHDVQIDLRGVPSVKAQAAVQVLTGNPQDINGITNPEQVIPKEADISDAGTSFRHQFPGYSVSVITLSTK